MFVACDEGAPSRRFWVIGSLWLPKKLVPNYEAQITDFRIKKKFWGEIKYQKIEDRYLDRYLGFLHIGLVQTRLEYSCIVIDTRRFTQRDMQKFHAGQEREAFMKFYRLLLAHEINYRLQEDRNQTFHVIYDTLSFVEPKLVSNFSRFLRSDVGSALECLEPCTSHICSLVQTADLVTGAVSSRVNNTVSSSRAGEKVSRRVEQWAGQSIGRGTLPYRRPFALWSWRPR